MTFELSIKFQTSFNLSIYNIYMKKRGQIQCVVILLLLLGGGIVAQDQKSNYSLVEIPAPSLKDNLIGTKDVQKIGVYLPPSYLD